ncbi:MAG: T9SS type A sorting domain-containing protein [Bacteroidota bacterium]
MRTFVTTILIVIAFFNLIHAQDPIAMKFVARSHTFRGVTIPYRLFIPDHYSTSKKFPIVLTLHGSGQRGTDNLLQVQSTRMATSWADPVNQAKYPCFVIAPQCPPSQDWFFNANIVSNILDSLLHEFTIDSNRLYVTGFSMGGHGTWEMIRRFPNRFAAAIPMCGKGNASAVSLFAQTPIWNFHGTKDPTVSVSESRSMIEALKNTGRSVVYTHCFNNDCSGQSDSSIEMYVKSHADLFYTEYKDGGHAIWDESYDYTFLFPWVFDNYRKTSGAIAITNLNTRRTLKGIETINWNSAVIDDSVEIWFSPDGGRIWRLVSRAEPNNGNYQWDTQNFNDCAFGLLKVCVKNHEGFIYGIDQSSYFYIDNGINGTPFAIILNGTVSSTTLNYSFRVGDPDDTTLILNAYYKTGVDFKLFHSEEFTVDSVQNHFLIDINKIPNSSSITVKLEFTDSNTAYPIELAPFSKSVSRQKLPASQISFAPKNTSAQITLNILDPSQTTNHSYAISFCDTAVNGSKTFSVYDRTEGLYLIQKVPFSSSTESDVFEGLSLFAEDVVTTKDVMRWSTVSGSPFYSVIDIVNHPQYLMKPFRHACDYKIIFYDHIVDTSLGYFGGIPTEIKFKVFNVTQGKSVKVVFEHTTGLYIYFFEQVANKERYTWTTFIMPDNGKIPDTGDTLYITMKKGISQYDTLLVTNIALSVKDIRSASQNSYELSQNYPNPFNPSTTIRYALPSSANVKLVVYDLLGREIATLVNEEQSAGWKEVQWNAKDVSSGIYFYKLQVGSFVETRKMLLVR